MVLAHLTTRSVLYHHPCPVQSRLLSFRHPTYTMLSPASPTASEASSSSHITTATTPSPTPLSKQKRRRGDPEDPARKARLVARQARNRASAQNSRDRKKHERESLESEVVSLRERNSLLESKVTDMEKGIAALMDFVQVLMKEKQQQPAAQPVQPLSQASSTQRGLSAPLAVPCVSTLSSQTPTSSPSAQTAATSHAAPTTSTPLTPAPITSSSSRSSPALISSVDARHSTAMTTLQPPSRLEAAPPRASMSRAEPRSAEELIASQSREWVVNQAAATSPSLSRLSRRKNAGTQRSSMSHSARKSSRRDQRNLLAMKRFASSQLTQQRLLSTTAISAVPVNCSKTSSGIWAKTSNQAPSPLKRRVRLRILLRPRSPHSSMR